MHYSWLNLERIIQPFNFQELFVVATPLAQIWRYFGLTRSYVTKFILPKVIFLFFISESSLQYQQRNKQTLNLHYSQKVFSEIIRKLLTSSRQFLRK